MVQRGSRARFLLKTTQPLFVVGERGGQSLERNFPAQLRVFGKKHFAHAADAERRNHGVAAGQSGCDMRRLRFSLEVLAVRLPLRTSLRSQKTAHLSDKLTPRRIAFEQQMIAAV